MSTVFKALADPTRRQVLQLLRQGPKSAGELVGSIPGIQADHVGPLRRASRSRACRQRQTGQDHHVPLKMSVLEEALMEFSELLGLDLAQRAAKTSESRDTQKGIKQMILKRMSVAIASQSCFWRRPRP